MAVTDQPTSIAYATDGVSVNFNYNHYFKAFTDLVVMVKDSTGRVATKVLTTDYSVSGTLDPKLATYSAGGLVTFNTAPASGGQVRISRRTQKVQQSVYVNGDPFPVSSHEVSQDTAELVIQEGSRVLFMADGPPTHGLFADGDKVEAATKIPGGSEGWIYCASPGGWFEYGTISGTQAG